jgi:hypothetical protein
VAHEHLLICRHPDENAVGWSLQVGSGDPLRWKMIGSAATKKYWAEDAIKQAITRDLSIDLTITSAPPAVAMVDPDEVPEGFHLTIVCPEGVPSAQRWGLLSMDRHGRFSLAAVEANIGVHWLLNRIADGVKDGPCDRDIFWLRPGMRAEDLLYPDAGKVEARRAGARQ